MTATYGYPVDAAAVEHLVWEASGLLTIARFWRLRGRPARSRHALAKAQAIRQWIVAERRIQSQALTRVRA